VRVTPRAYYNEFDPGAAAWLRELIKAGAIMDGEVDTRSIVDVRAEDLRGFTRHHFFAGIGGWDLALQLADWPVDRPVMTGSCPCQSFSAAGKQKGFADERHLWPVWFNLVREFQPETLFGEQVAAAIGKGWLDLVQDDLEGEDYAFAPIVLPACSVGALHPRNRIWFTAHSKRDKQSWKEPRSREIGRVGGIKQPVSWYEPWQSALSRFRVVGDGLPRNVGACDAARNAIVPQVAAEVIGAFLDVEDGL